MLKKSAFPWKPFVPHKHDAVINGTLTNCSIIKSSLIVPTFILNVLVIVKVNSLVTSRKFYRNMKYMSGME